jgi:hypothetical protein
MILVKVSGVFRGFRFQVSGVRCQFLATGLWLKTNSIAMALKTLKTNVGFYFLPYALCAMPYAAVF